MKSCRRNNSWFVLWLSFFLLASVSGLIFIWPEHSHSIIFHGALWVRDYFGFFYLWLGFFIVCFLFVIAALPVGKTRLGGPLSKPRYSLWSWTGMLYSAGMGSGIILRSVQEPVYMQQRPPVQTSDSHIMGLEWTFYHWGVTAWAFYGLFALVIAYYTFVKGRPVTVSDCFVHKSKKLRSVIIVILVNVFSCLTTTVGVMAAVGLGSTQIMGGIDHLTDSSSNIIGVLGVSSFIFLVACLSALKGISKGIKRISDWNMLITLFVLLLVFVQGDMLGSVTQFFRTLFHYLLDFVQLSLAIGEFNPGSNFLFNWTYFYWAFWIAWAPFTGVFIARISYGRTVRDMILGTLCIPVFGTFLWFSIFGHAAFDIISSLETYNGMFDDVFTSIFIFFDYLPLGFWLQIITVILLLGFLITSVDSAVFVLSMFSDRGNRNPSKMHRLVWSVAIMLFTSSVLLLSFVTGDSNILRVLQQLLIITSLPFGLFMVYITIYFSKDFLKNVKKH